MPRSYQELAELLRRDADVAPGLMQATSALLDPEEIRRIGNAIVAASQSTNLGVLLFVLECERLHVVDTMERTGADDESICSSCAVSRELAVEFLEFRRLVSDETKH